jgi:hypothetical protein
MKSDDDDRQSDATSDTCGWRNIWFDATSWQMLLEIDAQGGWSQSMWEMADAINGGPGIVTGAGLMPPDRESSESGLGCDFS